MRALRVLGLAQAPENETVKNLVCEDPVSGEQFSIPCDDRLRAGARGDLSRFGQLEIEMESQLRPREIQSRIRAGATVEQVASLAGTTTSRVERFAYPVLLERASVAEKAKKARPAIDGITAGISVADTVAATLAARGHDGDMRWDAFKDEDGWVLTLRWNAGRSENEAQWLFHPGPDGGTLSARDEAAAEIVDPALRILRPLRPVRPDSVSAVLLDPTLATEPVNDRPSSASARVVEPSVRSGHPAGSKLPAPTNRPAARPGTGFGDRKPARNPRFGVPTSSLDTGHGSAERVIEDIVERIVEDTVTDERTGVNPVITRRDAARTGTESARSVPSTAAHATSGAPAVSAGGSRPLPAPATTPPSVTSGPSSGVLSSAGPSSGVQSSTAAGPASPVAGTPSAAGKPAGPSAPAVSAKPSRKGHRPAMPSWEDVLLGTRSTGR